MYFGGTGLAGPTSSSADVPCRWFPKFAEILVPYLYLFLGYSSHWIAYSSRWSLILMDLPPGVNVAQSVHKGEPSYFSCVQFDFFQGQQFIASHPQVWSSCNTHQKLRSYCFRERKT